jgi:hypothetical protein
VPGKIHVTVSASGLASDSFDIVAEEIKPDSSFINEPLLDNRLRTLVVRPAFKVSRLEEIPKEIQTTYDDFNLPPSDTQYYAKTIREYILKNNPKADSSSVEFKTLISLFTSHLVNNRGRLVTDDYNFNVRHYNNCKLISGYINATKLPTLFKDCLKMYYAEAIIRDGNEKDPGDEMNWLNWIPSGGTVVISQEENVPVWPKGTVITSKTELPDLIEAVYPVFARYNDVAKERALTFISKMNPYIHVISVSEQSRGEDTEKVTKVSYIADKGKPILIPFIKFITE